MSDSVSQIVVFGTSEMAEIATGYMASLGDIPAAYVVDRDYMQGPDRYGRGPTFSGKPVIAFEDFLESSGVLSDGWEYKLAIPIYNNALRRRVYEQAIKAKIELYTYVDSSCWCGAKIGEGCFILNGNTIQAGAKIGNGVVIWSGNHIGHHSTIGDFSYISSHVAISGHCDVGEECWFGVNSAVRDGRKLAKRTIVGMSAAIVADTEPESLYLGVPARRHPTPVWLLTGESPPQ